MTNLQLYITESIKPINDKVEQLIQLSPRKRKNINFCIKWPIEVVTDLTCRIESSHQPNGQYNIVDWLISSISTRYIFDLLANVSVMLNSESENLRNTRQEQWLKLRDLVVMSDGSYSIPLENIPKKNNKVKSIALPKRKGETDDIELVECIPIITKGFIFSDPWNLTMAQKVAYIPTNNKELFLERWKLYSFISHGSSFSLWPTWSDPVPLHDAIQGLSTLLDVVSKHIDAEFNSLKFLSESFELIEQSEFKKT